MEYKSEQHFIKYMNKIKVDELKIGDKVKFRYKFLIENGYIIFKFNDGWTIGENKMLGAIKDEKSWKIQPTDIISKLEPITEYKEIPIEKEQKYHHWNGSQKYNEYCTCNGCCQDRKFKQENFYYSKPCFKCGQNQSGLNEIYLKDSLCQECRDLESPICILEFTHKKDGYITLREGFQIGKKYKIFVKEI